MDEIEDEDWRARQRKNRQLCRMQLRAKHMNLKKNCSSDCRRSSMPVPETVTGETRQIVEEKERKPKETVKEEEVPKERKIPSPLYTKTGNAGDDGCAAGAEGEGRGRCA